MRRRERTCGHGPAASPGVDTRRVRGGAEGRGLRRGGRRGDASCPPAAGSAIVRRESPAPGRGQTARVRREQGARASACPGAVNESIPSVLDRSREERSPPGARMDRSFRSAFPDFRMEIVDLIAEGDKVVAHFRCSGTLRASGGGTLRPEGASRASMRSTSSRSRTAGLRRRAAVEDNLTRMRQLGIEP